MTAMARRVSGLGLPDAAAQQLHVQLRDVHRIASEVHRGDGVALVVVSTALLAWTDGVLWWWWTGRIDEHGQRVYARGYTANVAATARRIDLRHEKLPARRPATAAAPALMG